MFSTLQGNMTSMKKLQNEMTVFESVTELFKKEIAAVTASL
ncbi:hypothetical protein JCM19238_774 [Vibrio ponticus]|nr:hypothetical protein JCM19238_774 [Vibrio ponticus]